jgi:hypothetical protein
MKKKIMFLLIVLIALAGCSAKLANDKQTFSDQGVSYSIQLPSSWQLEKNDKELYGREVVFAATDQKSNSIMFVSTTRKETMDLKDFGSKTREQLASTYNYKNVEDVYMKEFKLNTYPAYKFTVFTTFKEKDVWAHIYYIETKTSLVQLVYYSADDNQYESRSKIIDQSARSLLETNAQADYRPEQATENNKADSDSVMVKNETYSFEIKGFRKLIDQQDQPLLVIRYEMTNFAEEKATADQLSHVVDITQKGQKLNQTVLPESEKNSALALLEEHQKNKLEKNESVEAVLVYRLDETTGEVLLTFAADKFPKQDPVVLDLDLLK